MTFKEKMEAYLDPFDGDGLFHSRDTDMDEGEIEYKCSECGTDWDGKSCFGYVNPICRECGTVSNLAKVKK